MMLRITSIVVLGALFYCASALANDPEATEPPEALLVEAAKSVVPDGEQIGDIQCDELEKRQSVEIDWDLPEARCYTFVAMCTSGLQDVSLAVMLGDKEVAQDRISGKRPVAKWCATDATSVVVKLTAYSGSGVYALGVFAEPQKEPVKADRVGGPEDDLVANRVRQLHKRFGKGRAAVSQLFRGNLKTDQEARFQLNLKKDHCYTVIAAGDQSVRGLAITLLDGKEKPLATQSSTRFYADLETKPCISSSGTYTVKVKMTKGEGQFGVQVFSD